MKQKISGLILILSLFLTACKLEAQPFANEIAQFSKQDSLQMPVQHAILFTGSSSFRMWDSLAFDFPEHTLINRAFGGSTIPNLIEYADKVIFKYKPKQILIYCGDNDLASSEDIKAKDVLKRFTTLFNMIRTELPDAQITYVSIKPSPSRIHLFQEMNEANQMIQKFLEEKHHTAFVDVFHAMLDEKGQPDSSLFISDQLHMNRKGYAIWQKLIEPVLLP